MMKKLFLAILLMAAGLMVSGQTYTVSVSGTVEDIDSGEPISDRMVFIMTDSISGEFFYYNMVVTDDDGYFEDDFDVPTGVSGDLFVSTYGCDDEMLTEQVEFSENNNEFTFTFLACDDGGGGDECQAMFMYYPADSSLLTIQFIDQSTGDPDTWSWSFGDGGTSTEQNPVHTYAESGEYLVNLSISNDSTDCNSTIEMMVFVGDSVWYPDSCMAMFFAYPDENDFMSMIFNDMSIGHDGNPPDNWSWDFGDGATSDEQNPVHTYTEEGNYEVCLTISTDDGECEDTYCEYIEVIDYENGCEAGFYYFPAPDSASGDGQFPIQFVDVSLGDPTSWSWEFGDGGTSTEQNPVHIYAEDGTYEVCLTIANPADSCESTYCEEIYVTNDSISDCYSWFEYEINDMTVDFEGHLNEEASDDAQYYWDFGDGETATGKNVSHTYAGDGIYPVFMEVTDSVTGCYSAYAEVLWIGDDITFNLDGNIYLQDSLPADDGTVYLMTFDTLGMDLINVAQTGIEENGHYEFEEIALENCIYFVQAELSENSAYYGQYVPTYHISALHWMDAMPVFPFFENYPADIYMIAAEGDNASGEGNISGMVTFEDGRAVSEGVEILLLDENNNPLTYDLTNEDGLFDFSQLPYGTYIVYTEIVGIETTPVTVTLTEDNPDANVNIVVRNGEALLGFGEEQSAYIENVGNIYPNPANGQISLDVNMKAGSELNVTVVNSYGQQLLNMTKQTATGINKLKLNIAELSKGIYFVKVRANDGVVHVQKLIKY